MSDSAGRGSPDFFEFGPFQLDVTKRALHRQGEYVAVTPKALETLLVQAHTLGVPPEELGWRLQRKLEQFARARRDRERES